MGLLEYLTSHALDEDYQYVAERSQESRHGHRAGWVAGAMLVVFALMAVTAAGQTSRNSLSDEGARADLIKQIQDRRTTLNADRARITKLRAEAQRLQDQLLGSTASTRGLQDEIGLLMGKAGYSAVHGEGVKVIVDDATDASSERNRVLDTDLQKLCNGLWAAGAEAISVNGHRLTNLTAIRHAGTAITVNYIPIDAPYTVLAIGDKRRLPARFADSTSGQAWLDLRRELGLKLQMFVEDDLSLPASPFPTLREAEPPLQKSTQAAKPEGGAE